MKRSLLVITAVISVLALNCEVVAYDGDASKELVEAVIWNDCTDAQKAVDNQAEVNMIHRWTTYFGHVHYATPLLIAAEKGNKEMVQLLLQAGANVNSRPEDFTPLCESIGSSFLGSHAYDPKKKYNPDTDYNLKEDLKRAEIAKLLIERGARNEIGTYWNGTPFLCAVNSNRVKTAELIRQKFGNNVIFERDDSQQNALHYAAMEGNPELVDFVLKAYADVDARYDLSYARNSSGNVVNVRSISGATPYHLVHTPDLDTAIKFFDARVPGIDDSVRSYGLPKVFVYGVSNCFKTIGALAGQEQSQEAN